MPPPFMISNYMDVPTCYVHILNGELYAVQVHKYLKKALAFFTFALFSRLSFLETDVRVIDRKMCI